MSNRDSPSPTMKASPVKKGSVSNSVNFLKPGSPTSSSFKNSGPKNFDKVKKNAKGGVLVTNDEITSAFGMLDADNTGQITLASLKKRIGVLFPEMSAMEYRFLMNNKKEMTLEDLKELVVDNEITQFDPVAEAYKIFEGPDGKFDGEKLRQAFVSYGFGELSDEELQILNKTADIDGDGTISLEDFRAMTEPAPLPRPGSPSAAARKSTLKIL